MELKKIKAKTQISRKKNVAAYARVSTGKDAMLHSLSNQLQYYAKLIKSNKEWQFCGLFSDEAISGTKDDRAGFNEMISQALEGKIDLIITKSISRFARNTITLLETVRLLTKKNVDVYFEEQNIHTLSADGELMLTILASYAQEEARSVSENMKWRIRANFKKGIPWNGAIFGYRIVDGKHIVEPEEAKVVKKMYSLYLEGRGKTYITEYLNGLGILTRYGKKWTNESVKGILRNYTYTGNLLLQKTYKNNYIEKKKKYNNGELPMYQVEDSHEAIIDLETFEKVQKEIERRAKKQSDRATKKERSPLSGLLVCGSCGKRYRRKVANGIKYWICGLYSVYGKKACDSVQIPNKTIEALTKEVLNLKTLEGVNLKEKLVKIVLFKERRVEFHLIDGSVVERTWSLESRSKSWTPEMREAARNRELERKKKNGKSNSNTIKD